MTSLEKRALCRLVQDERTRKKLTMIKNFQAEEKSQVIEMCLRELVYLLTIPKKIVCVDEKYLRHCLEMIHISAGTISLHTGSLKSGISLEGFLFPLADEKYNSDSADFFVKCGSENLNSTVSGHWIIGSINESKSMKNIMKHPLLNRVGVLEDNKDDSGLEFPNSGSHSVICLPRKLNRSNEMSTCSIDVPKEPLCSLGSIVSSGMLQCTLTDGEPHYVFSVDEKSGVYEASLLSTESSAKEGTQWMYSFNLRNGRQKEGQVASNKELSHVGTMKVSARFTTCPNNFKITETEFTLYGLDEKTKDESISGPLSQSFRAKKGLSKKVASPFKPSLSVRKRTKSVFWRTSSVTDSCPWSPPTESHRKYEKQIQPYSEIASIIIRKHVNIPPKKIAVAEPGGWGTSILKRVDHKEGFNSKCHQRCRNEFCSTTDIIIPAGYHSQSEVGDGVPSSLIQRWKSGGQCDCGGWDIGCPLTMFTTRPIKNTAIEASGNQEECRSFDMVLKGRARHHPQMKMLNISRDLYWLTFRSSLSELQCFAIAVANLHCQNSKLQTQSMEIRKDVEIS